MGTHGAQTVAKGIHISHAYEYADAIARTGATGLAATDVGKHARQLDDNSFWVLQNHSPVTWAGVSTTTVIIESGGPTALDIGAIADGKFLKRSGTDIVGDDPGATSTGGVLGVVLIKADSSAKTQYPATGAGLTSALAAATAGDEIHLGPLNSGTPGYTGNFTIPINVAVIGAGNRDEIILNPSDLNDHTVVMQHQSQLHNVTVNIPTGAGKAAIYQNSASIITVTNVKFVGQGGSGEGLFVDGTNPCGCRYFRLLMDTGTCETMFHVKNPNSRIGGAFLSLFNATATNAIYVEGGRLTLTNTNISSTLVTKGIYLTGTGDLISELCTLYDVTTGLHIDSSTVTFESIAFRCDEFVTNHLTIDAGITPTVHITSGHLDRTKISYPTTATDVILTYIDETEGDRGFLVEGELVVGRVGFGHEAVIGEGDSHVIGMKVFWNTNGEIGTWTDVTADAISASGSPLNVWPGLTVNNAIYIGGDSPFPGVKVEVLTAISGGLAEIQYWNGSAWVEFATMASLANYPYTQGGRTSLVSTGSKQVRFADIESTWAMKTLNGENKYWFRSIITSTVSVMPVVEQFKLHTNRFEINRDGFTEYFGKSRQVRALPTAHRILLEPITGSSPQDETIDPSLNISIASTGNELVNNAIDAKGGFITIPEGLDTSFPLTIRVTWLNIPTTGDVELELTYRHLVHGDALDGTLTDTTLTEVVTVPGTTLTATATEFEVPVVEAVPGDGLAIKLLRDATGGNADDTAAGSVVLVQIDGFGTFWRG